MIKELTWEITKCLKDGYYMAALTTALTLPDICGKAEFPDLKKTKERYVQWYNEHILKYDKEKYSGMYHLNGDLVYALRCAVLHQGNPNIDEQTSEKANICYFELFYRRYDGGTINMGQAAAKIEEINGEKQAIDICHSVDIKLLCYKLCVAARLYYNKHKEKFNFFNYRISSCDFHTRQIFCCDINDPSWNCENNNEKLDIDILYQMACEHLK